MTDYRSLCEALSDGQWVQVGVEVTYSIACGSLPSCTEYGVLVVDVNVDTGAWLRAWLNTPGAGGRSVSEAEVRQWTGADYE